MRKTKTKLRWDHERQNWREVNTYEGGRWFGQLTHDWLGKCLECGIQRLFRFGKGSCDECRIKRYRQINLLSGKAHNIVNKAKEEGLLPLLDGSIICVDCREYPAEVYDHRSYDRPLAVDPVCRSCNVRRGPAIEVAHLRTPLRRLPEHGSTFQRVRRRRIGNSQ